MGHATPHAWPRARWERRGPADVGVGGEADGRKQFAPSRRAAGAGRRDTPPAARRRDGASIQPVGCSIQPVGWVARRACVQGGWQRAGRPAGERGALAERLAASCLLMCLCLRSICGRPRPSQRCPWRWQGATGGGWVARAPAPACVWSLVSGLHRGAPLSALGLSRRAARGPRAAPRMRGRRGAAAPTCSVPLGRREGARRTTRRRAARRGPRRALSRAAAEGARRGAEGHGGRRSARRRAAPPGSGRPFSAGGLLRSGACAAPRTPLIPPLPCARATRGPWRAQNPRGVSRWFVQTPR